jgi:hypothetical protein
VVADDGESWSVEVPSMQGTDRVLAGIEGLLGESAGGVDPGDPAPGTDCNCQRDGDWHPAGSGGCEAGLTVQTGLDEEGVPYRRVVPTELSGHADRPVEVVELPEYIRAEPDESAAVRADQDALRAEIWGMPTTDPLADLARGVELIKSGDRYVAEVAERLDAAQDVEAGLQAIVGAAGDLPSNQGAKPEASQVGAVPDHRELLVGEHGPELFTPFVPYPWAYTWVRLDGDEPVEGPWIIRAPGIYQMEQEDYFADPVLGGSMSNSDGRALSLPGCPEQFHHDKLHGVRKISDAFDRGHAAHAEVLGVGVELAIFPKHDARTTEGKAIRREWNQARADGKTPITEDDYAEVQAMAEALRRHRLAGRLMQQPMDVEQCLFWHDQQTGVMRRAMLDMLPTGRVGQSMVMVDYKTAQAVAPDHAMRKKIYDNGYHRQMATYIDGVLALGLAESVRAILLFQCTKAPYIVTPIELNAEALRIGRIENLRALTVFEECTRTGVWPGYTDGVETAGVPYYIERDYEGVNR